MNTHLNFDNHSGISHLIDAIDQYGGGCDPDFDTGLGELERQFAEYRMTLAND